MVEKEILEKIKRLRNNKQITLKALAEKSGLTEGYLSRIENSDTAPPISTLGRIAKGLDIDISYFFLHEKNTTEENPSIVIDKAKSQTEFRFFANPREKTSIRYQYEPIATAKKGKNMEPYLLVPDFDLGGVVRHNGENFLHVVEGTVELFYGTEKYTLEEGDSAYFDAHIPHQTKSLGDKKAKLLIIIYRYRKV